MLLIGTILRVVIWSVAMRKIYEIILYIFWITRRGDAYRDDLFRHLKIVKVNYNSFYDLDTSLYDLNVKYKVPWPFPWRLEWRFIKSTKTISMPFKILRASNRIIGRWLFRQPIVVLMMALLLIFFPDRRYALFESIITLSLIVLELADALSARAVLGFADNFRCDFSTDPANSYKNDNKWSKTKFLSKFILSSGIFVFTSMIGFAALYLSAYNVFGSNAFVGLLKDGTAIQLQMIYFSVVTIDTVGFGDIHPNIGVVQMLAMCEILFSAGIVYFLFFALSNTFTHE